MSQTHMNIMLNKSHHSSFILCMCLTQLYIHIAYSFSFFWKVKRNFNLLEKRIVLLQQPRNVSNSYNRNVNVFMVSISAIVKVRTMLQLDSTNSYVNFVRKNKIKITKHTFTALYWNNTEFSFSPTREIRGRT